MSWGATWCAQIEHKQRFDPKRRSLEADYSFSQLSLCNDEVTLNSICSINPLCPEQFLIVITNKHSITTNDPTMLDLFLFREKTLETFYIYTTCTLTGFDLDKYCI